MRLEEMVRREVLLPAGRDEVWEALTDPARLSEWFGAEVSLEPRPRAAVELRAADGTVRRGVVVAAGRPYRLVIDWWNGIDESDPSGTRVEFTLEEAPSGTLLTVTESARPSQGAGMGGGLLTHAGAAPTLSTR
jgi:uncharacterized protein YndB with AHSA1/START domain